MSDPLHLNELVRHPELGFVQTSRFFVLDASPNTPSVNTAAQTTSSSSSLSSASPQNIAEELNQKIVAVGDEIRSLKAAKASKDEIMAKVGVLNGLKDDFEAKTGSKYVPPASAAAPRSTKSKGSKAVAVSEAAAPSTQVLDPAQKKVLDEKFAVIKSIGEECTKESDLAELLRIKPDSFRLYDGFEPSGRMHIAQGIFKAINVNKCTASGGTFVFWVADWFALMNDKMGGDLEKIKDVGRYFVEVWTAAGMDMKKVEFRWASEDITKKADTYWPQMLDIARRFTLARVNKCCTIMGRAEGNLTAAQILYPLMQCTDVFFLRADICQLGVDQRKVNMLAREYCVHAGIKLKPVILSHHMIYGLKAGQAKMSKSDADSAIFMEDTRADIERKITNAFCPTKGKDNGSEGASTNELRLVVDDLENPCLDYVKHIVLSDPTSVFEAGGVKYTKLDDVKRDFLNGSLSEKDLKSSLIDAVDALVAPVRKHFTENKEASALLKRIAEYKRRDKAAAESKKVNTKPFRRMSLGLDGKAHMVVAPLPTAHCPLSVVFTLLSRLKSSETGTQPVLWLPDWSAMVLSCLDGDIKVIKSAYVVMIEAMKTVDAKFGGDGLKNVQIMFQSEAILKNPSDYWISVINVGRALKVKEVQTGYPSFPQGTNLPQSTSAPGAAKPTDVVPKEGQTTVAVPRKAQAADEEQDEEQTANQVVSEPVGCVIAALMFVGDVIALAPASISCEPSEGQVQLALDYWKSSEISSRNKLVMPKVMSIPATSTWMSKEPPQLSALFSATTHDDDYFIGDDPKAGANKKMKRAFCEPMNTTMNPPLSIARHVILPLFGSFQAGEKTYTGPDAWSAMKTDFEADVLSPQLLKPATTTSMAGVLEAINTHMKKNPEGKKAEASLKSWATKKKRGGGGGGGGGGKKQQQSKKK